MTDKLVEQILEVRETGLTNMFDVFVVQRIAYEMELYDLVVFLCDKKNWGRYTDFIFSGRR